MVAPGLSCRKVARSRVSVVRLDLVDLGDDQPVGEFDLPASKRLLAQLPQAVDRIHRDDDLADHDMVDQDRIGADRRDDRAGIGKAAGFQHDLIEPRLARGTADARIA